MTRRNRDAIEEYEAQQRAFEEERYARILREMQPEPVNFCADDGDELPDLTWLEMALVVVGLTSGFLIAALWMTAP